MTTITFLGAGSVVFTRELLADLLGFDDLTDVHIALHDIDAERLETAEAIARQHDRAARRARRKVTATTDRRRALEGADFVINTVQVGMYAATVTDFEVPAPVRPAPDHRRHPRASAASSGRCAPSRCWTASPRDMLEVCPDAWLLNYTNPMAMNVAYLARSRPTLKVVGLCHSVYWTVRDLCELVGVPLDEVTYHSAGVNHQAWLLRWERDGDEPLPAAGRARSPPTRELRRRVRVDMYRRLGYYPTETSEHSSEYVPLVPPPRRRDRAAAHPGRRLRADQRGQRRRVRARPRSALAGRRAARRRAASATEYAPQVIHSMVTGTERTHPRQRRQPGLIDNLPAGPRVEVPCARRRRRRPTRAGRRAAAAVRRAQPRLPQRGRAHRAAAVSTATPGWSGRRRWSTPTPQPSLTVDEIWALCDDLVGRARRPAAPSRCAVRPPLTVPVGRGVELVPHRGQRHF